MGNLALWAAVAERRQPPSPANRADLFVVPTIGFIQLYVLVVRLDRRELVWINVTRRPTAEWIAQQITEAFPWSEAPRYLIRDQGRICGTTVRRRLRAMGIRDKPIAPGSPWQNGYAERLIGTIRRECVDHLIVFGEAHLRRIALRVCWRPSSPILPNLAFSTQRWFLVRVGRSDNAIRRSHTRRQRLLHPLHFVVHAHPAQFLDRLYERIGCSLVVRVIVEKLKAAEPGKLYPQFVGGERRCPPEDCGGVPGYYEFLKNIASKRNQKRKAALDWYGGPYDPDEIDEQQIVTALNRIANTSRHSR
jgi:transposase InsO family protein